jgi:hypothetical protein
VSGSRPSHRDVVVLRPALTGDQRRRLKEGVSRWDATEQTAGCRSG